MRFIYLIIITSIIACDSNEPRYPVDYFKKDNIEFFKIGKTSKSDNLTIKNFNENIDLKISEYRDEWFSTSVLFDQAICFFFPFRLILWQTCF